MKSTLLKTIPLHCTYRSPGLQSRMIWQELFNYYREHGGLLEHMDNILIDYQSLIQCFDEPDFHFYNGNKAYWTFWHCWTQLSKYHEEISHDWAIEISVGENEIVLNLLTSN
jgi:hypothetical protein